MMQRQFHAMEILLEDALAIEEPLQIATAPGQLLQLSLQILAPQLQFAKPRVPRLAGRQLNAMRSTGRKEVLDPHHTIGSR